MKRSLQSLAAVAALLGAPVLAPQQAQATVVIQPSLEDMTAKSGVIIHAVVEDQTVTLGEEGKRILTLSRLRVLDGIKGAKTGDTVTLYQVGGEYGGRVARIVGVNDFHVGEEVMLFGAVFLAQDTVKFLQAQRTAEVPATTLNPTGGWMVTYGVGLGKFQVVRPAHGTPMATEQLGDVETATHVNGKMVMGTSAVRTSQPLDVFKQTVRSMAAARVAP